MKYYPFSNFRHLRFCLRSRPEEGAIYTDPVLFDIVYNDLINDVITKGIKLRLGKEIIYLRDKNIKDGGPVYFNRPVPTKQMYSNNINILLEELEL